MLASKATARGEICWEGVALVFNASGLFLAAVGLTNARV